MESIEDMRYIEFYRHNISEAQNEVISFFNECCYIDLFNFFIGTEQNICNCYKIENNIITAINNFRIIETESGDYYSNLYSIGCAYYGEIYPLQDLHIQKLDTYIEILEKARKKSLIYLLMINMISQLNNKIRLLNSYKINLIREISIYENEKYLSMFKKILYLNRVKFSKSILELLDQQSSYYAERHDFYLCSIHMKLKSETKNIEILNRRERLLDENYDRICSIFKLLWNNKIITIPYKLSIDEIVKEMFFISKKENNDYAYIQEEQSRSDQWKIFNKQSDYLVSPVESIFNYPEQIIWNNTRNELYIFLYLLAENSIISHSSISELCRFFMTKKSSKYILPEQKNFDQIKYNLEIIGSKKIDKKTNKYNKKTATYQQILNFITLFQKSEFPLDIPDIIR